MADLNKKRSARRPKISRHFSEKFKKDVVNRIEKNEFTVLEVSRLYGVSSTSVYKWIYKYSILYQKGYRQIIEPMSTSKKVKELQQRIKELEQMVGQKQVQLEFMEKLIEISEEDYGIDILKKSGSKPKSGSGKTGKK